MLLLCVQTFCFELIGILVGLLCVFPDFLQTFRTRLNYSQCILMCEGNYHLFS